MPRTSRSTDPVIIFNEVRKTFQLRHARSFKQTATSLLKGQLIAESFNALDDVSFTVHAGESIAVMGHNGSGKSTTLKLLSGVLRPTGGWIRTQGRVAGLIEVGAGFHPDLTGRENVYLNAAILGMSKEETDARFDEIVEFAEIGRFIDTEVKRYSSGMYARLGFSVAVHTELDILLVDEVLSVGDAKFREKCNKKMAELQAQGKTMFIVSHSAAQVRKLCDRGIVLDHGRIVFDGPIDEAIEALKPEDQRPVRSNGFVFKRTEDARFKLTGRDASAELLSSTLPAVINDQPVVAVGPSAFMDSTVERIVIPEPIERLERGAFFRANSLREVSFPSTLRDIGKGAFRGCTSLKSLELPEGLETIGPRAFQECTALESITLPRSLKNIAQGAFLNSPKIIFKCPENSEAARIMQSRVPGKRIMIVTRDGGSPQHLDAPARPQASGRSGRRAQNPADISPLE